MSEPFVANLALCPYCGNPVVFRPDSTHVYGTDYGPIFECVPCKARVGCHKNSDPPLPLGTVANELDRRRRGMAHSAFDPIWKKGGIKRKEAYKWLAEQLGITYKACHISWMHGPLLVRVVEVCQRRAKAANPTEVTDG